MKLLYIHQHFSTPEGSGTTRSFEFSKYLVEQGHQVTILCGSNQKAKTGLSGEYKRGVRRGVVQGIHVIEINIPYSNHQGFLSRVFSFLKFSFRSLRFVMTEKYDVIYATSTPLTVAIPALFAKFFRFKRYVFEVRDLWPDLPKAMGIIKSKFFFAILKFYEKMTYKFATHCVGLSPGMCDGIVSSGVKPDRVSMIPNGCDLEFFDVKSVDSTIASRWYEQFSENDFVAVFTGAHGYANGLSAVIDAAELLKKDDINHIKFLFVGDGKCKPEIIERVTTAQLSNCIFWDPMPKTSLRHILKLADVGMMLLSNIPAFYEGTSPNKFFDYLAAGLPVFNNYPGWVARLITENNCGKVVKPDDPKAFLQGIVELSHLSEEALADMGCRSRLLAERSFDRKALSKQFLAVLSKITSKYFNKKLPE